MVRATLKNNNFFIRLISSLVLFPTVLFLLFKDGIYAVALLIFVMILALYEWNNLCRQASFSLIKKQIWFAAGNFYILCACYVFWKLPSFTQIYFILMVCIADIGAYVIGRWLRGPKLAPKISPNKTWSGVLGGIFFLFVFILLLPKYGLLLSEGSIKLTLANPLLYVTCAFFGIVVPAGDLLESWCKRQFGVKDSGKLIPGHGGILDRIDSLLAVLLAWGIVLIYFKS